MTVFPLVGENIRPIRFASPQSIASTSDVPMGGALLIGCPGGRVLAALGRGYVRSAESDRYPPVLLHPVEHDLGVRPFDVRVLEHVLHESVKVPPVPEATDEQGV